MLPTVPCLVMLCLCLCACVRVNPQDELGDLYSYYATIGAASPQPNQRAAAVAIISTLVSHQPHLVLRQLERLADLKEDSWWETQLQLARLVVGLLGLMADAGAATAPPPGALQAPTTTSSRGTAATAAAAAAATSAAAAAAAAAANRAAGEALGLRAEDIAAVLAIATRTAAAIVAQSPVGDVAATLATGLLPLLRPFPSLAIVWVGAMVSLPPAARGTLLAGTGDDPTQLPVSLASGFGAEYAPLSLPGPVPPLLTVLALADTASKASLQQLEEGHFTLLEAALERLPSLATHGAGDGSSASGSAGSGGDGGDGDPLDPRGSRAAASRMLDPLRALRDYIFVGLCEPPTCPLAAGVLARVFDAVPGAASFLAAPTLVGSLLLLLQPPSGDRHEESEALVADLLRDVAAQGPPFDRGVLDALTALAKRGPALLDNSPFGAVLDDLAGAS